MKKLQILMIVFLASLLVGAFVSGAFYAGQSGMFSAFLVKAETTGSFTFGNTAIGTIPDQTGANSQSVSYFTCTANGYVTDIIAFINGSSTGNVIAALYAVSGGSAGALLEQSSVVSVSTTFSWVDFELTTPYSVNAGTAYGLALMGNVALNVRGS